MEIEKLDKKKKEEAQEGQEGQEEGEAEGESKPKPKKEKKEDGEDGEEGFDLQKEGFPANTLQEYKIDKQSFEVLSRAAKLKLLQEKRALHDKETKLYFMFLRENKLLHDWQMGQGLVTNQQYEELLQRFKDFLNEKRFVHWFNNMPMNYKQLMLLNFDKDLVKFLPEKLQQYCKKYQKNLKVYYASDSPEYDCEDGEPVEKDKYVYEDEIASIKDEGEEDGDYPYHDDDEEDDLDEEGEGSSEEEEEEEPEHEDEDASDASGRKESEKDEDELDVSDSSETHSQAEKDKEPEEEKERVLLTATIPYDKLIVDRLGNPENFVQLIPTMDDEFIQKLYQLLFISVDYDEIRNSRVMDQIKYWLYNPFNAYRFIELVIFNVLNIAIQRQGMDNPLFDLEILEQYPMLSQLVCPFYNKYVQKYLKQTVLTQALVYMMSQNIAITQVLLLSYPLSAKDKYELSFAGYQKKVDELKSFEVSMRPIEVLKDLKLNAVFKGLPEQINIFQLCQYLQKWTSADQKALSALNKHHKQKFCFNQQARTRD